jgi:transposase InsO family protein
LKRELAVASQERDILKKSHQHLLAGRGMRYPFIAEQRGGFPISRMCAVLGVSRSGYYAWRERGPSPRRQANQVLVEAIRRVHRESRRSYGSPRIHVALRGLGLACGRHRVARLMRQQGLVGVKAHRRPFTSQRSPGAVAAPNLLGRDFHAPFPNQKWVADITTIATAEGRLYLATILDLCSRMIVGWSIADHMQTSLVERALLMALGRRPLSHPLLHHSDHGSQYTSDAYQARLAALRARISMNGIGNCYDNAVMESFYATLKTECAPRPFHSRQEATTAIFEYIEGWYNRQRIHSSLGYLSPASFEQQISLDKNTVHKSGASPIPTRIGQGRRGGRKV